jgi:membrane protein
MKKINFNKTFSFFTHDVWYVEIEQFPYWQRFFIKTIRIVLLAFRDFNAKDLILHASALTYYTLLSIVPVIAMIFGIAKGFGLEAYIAEQLTKAFNSQPQIQESLISYSHNMLNNTSGGVVAGIGFALLIWSVIQVLSSVEDAFNAVWYVKRARTWARKFTDYLAIMILAPLLIIAEGSINIFISTQIHAVADLFEIVGEFAQQSVVFTIKLLPFITTWSLFYLVYIVMPNTKVKPRSAIIAAIIAGTIFQFFQWGYIEFQVGVSRYNAIYGSFASIPLFITWLYFSWAIVLIGAEVSYSFQHVADFTMEQHSRNISTKMRQMYHLYLLHFIALKFKDAAPAPGLKSISESLKLPTPLCKSLIDEQIKAGLLMESVSKDDANAVYTPAMDIVKLNIAFVLRKLNEVGEMKRFGADSNTLQTIKEKYFAMEKEYTQSPTNINIIEI